MCGIAAIVDLARPGAAQRDRVLAMRHAMAHRGPDGHGVHVASHAALAHTRLAVHDLAGSAQPIVSPDGRWALVYNGEIYNDAELRAELSGRWEFRTRGDAEVALGAWAIWGPAALARLDGMFAFAIWDEERRELSAARDRLGVKPLWLRHRGGELILASEIKAILAASREPPRLDEAALREWLLAPCFATGSPISGIVPLDPGHHLVAGEAGLSVTRWWSWGSGPDGEEPSPDAEELRAALTAAVRRQLRGDVPVATFLSGGIDSSLIASLARPEATAAYTIRFADQDRYDYAPASSAIVRSDDTPFATHAASALGLDHRVVHATHEDVLAAIPAIAAADDTIPAWEQQIAQHLLARAAAARFKVVLVGDAADETHHGYRFLLDRSVPAILELFGAPRRAALLHPAFAGADPIRALQDGYGEDLPALIVRRWLVRLLQNGDAHTMASSLEARVPFSDVRLVELARRVPLRTGFDKALLRAAATGLVPEAIRTRPKSALPKDQAVAPLYQREAARILDEESPFLGQYLRLDAVHALCQRPIDEMERAFLFHLVAFCHWRRARGIT